jgi:hypothetical protein
MKIYIRGAKFFEKPRSYLKILGVKTVTRSKFDTENPLILGATAKIYSPWGAGAKVL